MNHQLSTSPTGNYTQREPEHKLARGFFSLEAIKISIWIHYHTIPDLNHYLDSTFNPICSRDPMMPLFKHADAGPHQPLMSTIPSNTRLSTISKSTFYQSSI